MSPRLLKRPKSASAPAQESAHLEYDDTVDFGAEGLHEERWSPDAALGAQEAFGNAGVAALIASQGGADGDDEGSGGGLGGFAWWEEEAGESMEGSTPLERASAGGEAMPKAVRLDSEVRSETEAEPDRSQAGAEATPDAVAKVGGSEADRPRHGGAETGAEPARETEGDFTSEASAAPAPSSAPPSTNTQLADLVSIDSSANAPAMMDLGDASPSALLDAVAAAPASQLGPSFAAATVAIPGALQARRDTFAEGLPELPTPTGLAARDVPPPERGAPALNASTELVLPKGQGPEPSTQPTPVPEAPAVEQAPTQLSGSEAGETEAGESEAGASQAGEAELIASAQATLASVQLPAEAVPAAAPPSPQVQLSGDSDPQRMSAMQGEATGALTDVSAQALAQTAQDFGEHNIAPAPDPELLSATTALGTPPALSVPTDQPSALPPELSAELDASATPLLGARLQGPIAQAADGQQQLDTDAQLAHAQAHSDVAEAEARALSTQLAAKEGAQAEVGVARADWQAGVQSIQADALSQAEAERAQQTQAIHAEKLGADAKARSHLKDAENQAAAKQSEVERQAAAETAKAETESGGFIGWARSAATAFIDGLKATVNALYDGLRVAVKAIFEAATKLATGVIELAQQAIAAYIRLYAEAVKRIVGVALAAFPELAEAIQARIDAAVTRATQLVQQAAELLKAGVVGALDLLASTLDGLLAFAQRGYNAAFTLIGMVVSGEWAEIVSGLENLLGAAGQAPPQFEAAAFEELLGGDLSQPLSPMELEMAGLAPAGAGAGQLGPPWSPENVGVDRVVTGLQLSPELSQQLMEQTGGEGELDFGWSEDPSRSMSAILGLDAAQSAQPAAEIVSDDGLSVRERASAKWTIMKQGLADWWSQSWPTVLAGGVLGVAGLIAANLLTGGAVMAALPPILAALGPLFMGGMAAQVGGHVADYLSKGWAGDAQGGGKSLAKALAVGAVELASLLTFKAGGAALKGAKAVAKGAKRAAQASARGAAKLAKQGADFVVRQGRVLLDGVGGPAFAKGFKSIDELGQGLLNKTKFKGYRLRVQRRRFVLEGKINPWVKVAEGEVVEVSDFKKKGAEGDWRYVDQKHLDSGQLQAKVRAQHVQQGNEAANQQLREGREETLEYLREHQGGHVAQRHGYQTSMSAHKQRVQTGELPNGSRSGGRRGTPKESSTKFSSPQAQAEALQTGRVRLDEDMARRYAEDPLFDPATAGEDGGPLVLEFRVSTSRKGGFGKGYRLQRGPDGGALMTAGQRSATKVRGLDEAMVKFKFDPRSGDWRPLTAFPVMK